MTSWPVVSLNEPDIFKDSFFLHYFLIENLLLATVTLWLAQLGSLMFRKLQDRFQYVNVFDLIGTQKTKSSKSECSCCFLHKDLLSVL